MACAACGRANPAAARFCGGCGAPVSPRCLACGAESQGDARFCIACGSSLAARPPDAAGARKVVTIVFADLAGSTALHERLDAESTRAFMDRYYRAMQGAVEAHGGTVTQLLGDGVKAVFGAPRVAEDDALRAVRAAVEMQRAFRALASEQSGAVGPVGLRVAVNTGEVVAQDETEIIGDPVNVAARLQQEAQDGDVLVGESTQRLVGGLVTLAPFGTFALKGRAEPVVAYCVVSLERPAGAPAVAFVGREEELQRLVAVHDAAVAAPRAHLAVILGSPGLGKSRLLTELGRRLGDRATLLTARCDATGGATFAPIAEALRTLLGIDSGAGRDTLHAAILAALPGDAGERDRIADGVAALLSGAPAPPEETFFVVRRLLAALATRQPVVLAIDDLHWAEPLLLDLAEHLVQWGAGIPLLVLAAARPELREARSSLTMPGPLVADVLTLSGLDAGAATRLAANVIGADALPAALAGRVLATSEGNPLFVGELVRMLVHDGVLRREGERWTAAVEPSALEMPPTIHALLAARIERLRPEERTVLERAAVVGRQFSRQAVAQLLPPEITDLDTRLEALRRSELVEPDTGWHLGEPVLRFHHALIRDAAYRRLLKGTRAELHARFADWLEGRVGESVEHDETLGWHLEQAHQHLRELGPVDARGRALGERASRRLAAAGRRALGRDDVPLAAGLLGRAVDRLDPTDPARADLALDWCEALLAAGEVGAASAAIDELGRFAGGSERLRAWHTCFAGELAVLTDPKSLLGTADAVAAAAETLAVAGDAAGEAKAHWVHAQALSRLGQIGACEAALDRALAAARRVSGDRRRANAVLSGAPLAALWGPGPVARASGRCLDVVRVLRITQGAPGVEAVALRCQAVLEALRGRSEAARRMIDSSRRMVEELGLTQGLLETEVSAGFVALIEGDADAAERSLRTAYEGLRGHGLGIDAARAAGLLGLTLLAQGRAGEAEALSHESEALAGDDLQAAITWRRVRAEALARRGEHAPAVELARAAVGIAAATDALLHHGDARLALAAALRAAGRDDEAAAEEARAIELWEAKGATLLAERARRGTSRAERVEPMPAQREEPLRPVRRVRGNAATALAARVEAAFAARNPDAFACLLADDLEHVHHATGAAYDREGSLRIWRSLLKADDLTCRYEPLATLGESLALCRASISASGVSAGAFDVGAYEGAELHLIETDAEGRGRRADMFPEHHLGDAIARLYVRHAELLPEGPERTRAAATARSIVELPKNDGWPFAAEIEFLDHRTVGMGAMRGAEAVIESFRPLFDLTTGSVARFDDVLGQRADALLVRWTHSGTDRSGGAFERCLCQLWIFGADGLVTRWEQFEADRDAEALARFDELAAGPRAVRPVARRVRPNAATAHMARVDAAIVAREGDALPALVADRCEVIDHTTGVTYDREGALATMRAPFGARNPTLRQEPLATLGDSLALCRSSFSAEGYAGATVAVGPYERETLSLVEVDQEGRRARSETFAADRLGDAVARLYERYAGLLPDGPERTRDAATARSIAAWVGPPDLARWAGTLAPGVETADHRTLGLLESARGVDAFVRRLRSIFELAADIRIRVDEVLGLGSDALLVHLTDTGTDRTTGGAFERQFIQLWLFGADGLVTRDEKFDPDRGVEALARFDELRAGAPAVQPALRRVQPNAATAHVARVDAAIVAREGDALSNLLTDSSEVMDHTIRLAYDGRLARVGWFTPDREAEALARFEKLGAEGQAEPFENAASWNLRRFEQRWHERDWEGVVALLGPGYRVSDRRSLVGMELEGEEGLRSLRMTFDVASGRWSSELLATRGERLALFRRKFEGEVGAVGPFENPRLSLIETGADGRRVLQIHFDPDDLDTAYGELDARYAAGEAAPWARTWSALGRLVTALNARDREELARTVAPDLVWRDHRILGLHELRSRDEYLERFRALVELAPDVALRVEHVLGLDDRGVLAVLRLTGHREGGPFEIPSINVMALDAGGRFREYRTYDLEELDTARAGFAEIMAAPPARPVGKGAMLSSADAGRDPLAALARPNAASAAMDRVQAAFEARDWARLRALAEEGARFEDRRRHALLSGDRDWWVANLRLEVGESGLGHFQRNLVATAGDRVCLERVLWRGGRAQGRVEIEYLWLAEVDEGGRLVAGVMFDAGDWRAASREGWNRWLARDAAAAAVMGPIFEFVEGWNDHDRARLRAVLEDDVVSHDRQLTGHGLVEGADAYLDVGTAVWALARDAQLELRSVLALDRHGGVGVSRTFGTLPEGGDFEIQNIDLVTVDRGRITRIENFEIDALDAALARFEELRPTASS
jgi:class 3 adenylate cyclase/tetratricopeptide (TPR) repeat protein